MKYSTQLSLFTTLIFNYIYFINLPKFLHISYCYYITSLSFYIKKVYIIKSRQLMYSIGQYYITFKIFQIFLKILKKLYRYIVKDRLILYY